MSIAIRKAEVKDVYAEKNSMKIQDLLKRGKVGQASQFLFVRPDPFTQISEYQA